MSPKVPLRSPHEITKPPFVRLVIVGDNWYDAVWVFTRNSVPSFAPSDENICALMLVFEMSPSVPLWSIHEITKPPFARLVILGEPWPNVVCVFTRNSVPTFAPSSENICALMLALEMSPSVPLKSSHVTTKPPFASSVISGRYCSVMAWRPAVSVLTRNSVPTLVPSLSNICALMSAPAISHHVTTNLPLVRHVIF